MWSNEDIKFKWSIIGEKIKLDKDLLWLSITRYFVENKGNVFCMPQSFFHI